MIERDMSLFAVSSSGSHDVSRPLADRLRPTRLADVLGQDHLLGETGALTRVLKTGTLGSLIFWGPPGSGKTTLARLIAQEVSNTHAFEAISAIFSGIADLKKIFDTARLRRESGKSTLLFVDEIHRFNRTQLDAFLPVMEEGTITLMGATTENPSFALTSALLSRARVLTLNAHDEESLEKLLQRAEKYEEKHLCLTLEARHALIQMADGDGRALLTLAEDIWRATSQETQNQIPLDTAMLSTLIQRRAPLYDKSAEGHYNLISALHKCVRGSDPDAALYYFARMLDGGEDPRFLARRLVRMAVEDVGLADPHALSHARAAADAYEQLGSPEGELALANAVIYLATAPKSNAAYVAFKSAMKLAKKAGSLTPPKSILNAPTKLMRKEGYGDGYRYDHDEPDAFSGQNYWPEELGRQSFYEPVERGFERDIKKRLEWWNKLRQKKNFPD
jgi:putative ATPase